MVLSLEILQVSTENCHLSLFLPKCGMFPRLIIW